MRLLGTSFKIIIMGLVCLLSSSCFSGTIFDGTNPLGNPAAGDQFDGNQDDSDADFGPSFETRNWPYDNSSKYQNYDSDKILVSGGLATVELVDQIDDDGDPTYGLLAGTHTDTTFNGGTSALELADPLVSATGTYESRVFDIGTDVSWTDITWLVHRPMGKELPANQGSEAGYTAGNFDMASNVAYYRFNELAYTDTSNEVTDSSSLNNHATPFSGTTVAAGRLNNAASFDGINDYIRMDDATFGQAITDRSVSFWFKPRDVVGRQILWEVGGGTNGYNVYLEGDTLYASAYSSTGLGNQFLNSAAGAVTANQWHHVVWVFDNVTDLEFELYLNGQQVDVLFPTGGDISGQGDTDSMGMGVGTTKTHTGNQNGQPYEGLIDEYAVWDRALTPAEIQTIWLRGALNVQIQVRSCAADPCIEAWKGPDGTAATYFSELENATFNPIGAQSFVGVIDNQYFQYQVLLESLETTATPQVIYFEIGPDHYDGSSPSIENKIGATYSDLQIGVTSFEQTLGGGNGGTITYQISNDGTNWYYFDGASWSAATGVAQSNPIATINLLLSTFVTDIGTGTFYYKAFLTSNGTQAVELSNTSLNFYYD